MNSAGLRSTLAALDRPIDPISLVAFVWKSRFWVLAFAVVGVAAAAVLTRANRPTVFNSTIPLTIDDSSANTAAMISEFNNNPGTFFDSLAVNAPPIGKQLIDAGITKAKFVLLAKGSQGDAFVPYKLGKGTPDAPQNLQIDFQLPFAIADWTQAGLAVKAINAAVGTIAERRRKALAASSPGKVDDPSQGGPVLVYQKVLQELDVKESEVESRYWGLLFDLDEKLKKAGIKIDPKENPEISKDAQIYRAIGILQQTGNLSVEDLTKVRQEFASIRADASTFSLYRDELGDAAKNAAKKYYAERLLAKAAGAMPPALSVSETGPLDSEQPVISSRPEAKVSVALFMGAILGAMLGGCTFAGRQFIRKNRERLVQAFA